MTTQDWNLAGGMPPELEAEQIRLRRQQKIADALLAQSQAPFQQQTAGGFVVPISPFEGAAKMLAAYGAKRKQGEVERGTADIGKRYNEGLAQAVSQYTSAKNAKGEPLVTYGDSASLTDPASLEATAKPDPRQAISAAMLSQYPQLRSLAQMDLTQLNRTEDREDQQAFRASEAQAAREARQRELEARLADARTTAADRAALQRELAQMRIDAQRDLRAMTGAMRQPPAPVAVMGPDGKPVYVSPDQAVGRQPAGKSAAQLPGSALKLQQEELDAINTSASINADVGALKDQIDSGKLAIGPVRNATSQAKNFLGLSDENSRNFASFRSTLEKLRNDSLRLNKGVQTEGDAQRAWNELVSSINDPKVVSQRLGEIQKINERAINLRRNNVNVIRSNYGVEPLEASPNPPAAVGSGSSGSWSVVR